MLIRNTHFSIIILVCLLQCQCGAPNPPMPTYESYRVTDNGVHPPLSDAWRKKLSLINDQPGKEDFKTNLQELTVENQNLVLEILNSISEQDDQLEFLQDFISFNKKDQGDLIDIILYLEAQNKPLLLKLVSSTDRLTIFEKLQMLKMINDLDPKSKALVEEFEANLEKES